MELRIRVDGLNVDDDMRGLRDWLAGEDDLRGRVRLEQTRPRPGEMGTVIDVITVALGSGGAATVLIKSITTWLSLGRSDVTVEVSESATKRTVKVSGARVKDTATLIREILGPKEG